VSAVRPVMGQDNVTLLTDAKVLKLYTGDSGRKISRVEVAVSEPDSGETQIQHFSEDIVALGCGAVHLTLTIIANALRVADH
jgi:hypothetical protein